MLSTTSCIVSIQAAMEIEKRFAPEKVQEECVVVIDVLRAFTTAAYAFAAGAEKLMAVESVDDAFFLKKRFPEALLMGELHALPIEGFDFSNSPHEIQKHDLRGLSLIQRTSAGTAGIVRSQGSQHVLAASFVVAEATLSHILLINPKKVTFVITGKNRADEDLALADYLEAGLIQKGPVDPKPYLQRVSESFLGQRFIQMSETSFPADLEAALAIDRFSFAMRVRNDEGISTIYYSSPVYY